MNRKQLYNEIIAFGLQEEIKSKYGKNYTQCTNDALQEVVNKIHKDLDNINQEDNKLYKLINILVKKKILLKSEVDMIKNA